MIRSTVTTLIALAVLSACSQGTPVSQMGLHPVVQFAEVEQRGLRILTRQPDNDLTKFYFLSKADAFQPHDDPDAEADRKRQIAEDLRERGFCPQGHEILERHEWLVSKGLAGDIVDLRYRVQCIQKQT